MISEEIDIDEGCGVPRCRPGDLFSWRMGWLRPGLIAIPLPNLLLRSPSMAAAVRGGDITGVIFHADKGSHYTPEYFQKGVRASRVVQSTPERRKSVNQRCGRVVLFDS